MTRHARCSPSGASAWMSCPVWESEESSSPIAALGSAIHALAELSLRSNQPASDFIGLDVTEGFTVDEDMARIAEEYVAVCHEFIADEDCHTWFVERPVNLEPITGEPGAVGTADFVAIIGNDLWVVDLKTGRRQVSAEDNPQLMIYAAALLHEFDIVYDIDNVHMMIVQPTIKCHSEATVEPAVLYEFQEAVEAAAQIRLSGTGDAMPSEGACRYCANRGTCTAQVESVLGVVADSPVTLDRPLMPQIETSIERIQASDKAHLAECFAAIKFVRAWCDAVEEIATADGLPGYKLVEGRKAPRSYIDPDLAFVELKEAGVPTSLLLTQDLASPTQVEKNLKGTEYASALDLLSTLVTQKPGRPVLVPESDKRPAIPSPSIFTTNQ